MGKARWILAIGLMTMWSIVAGPQEAQPEAASDAAPQSVPPAASAPPAGASPEAGAPEAGTPEADTPEAGEGQPVPESAPLDELFIPSKEIAADEEVIFPVNI